MKTYEHENTSINSFHSIESNPWLAEAALSRDHNFKTYPVLEIVDWEAGFEL